jgi:DNA polymerase III delta prime subunit
MEILELRENVLQAINAADERLLRVLKAVIETYTEDDKIVAYTISGHPLSKFEYKKDLIEALENIKLGAFITQEDLEQETENWQ